LAALVTGAVPLLCFPEPALWWLAWVSLVPLLALVAAAATPRAAAWRTWLAGVGFAFGVAHWSVAKVGPALLLFAAALGAAWIPWGLAVHRLLNGRRDARRVLAACVVLAAIWVVIEFARSWEHFGGPGALLGTTQWNSPPTLALASLGGVWLVSFVLVAANVAVLFAVRPAAPLGVRLVAAGIVLTLASIGPVWHLLRDSSASRRLRVALVQPGQPSGSERRLDVGAAITRRLADVNVGLVVWGESSITVDLEARGDVLAALTRLSRDVDAPLLVNVDARRRGGRIVKSAVLLTAEGIVGHYEKMRLVLFGEYIPARRALGWLADVTGAAKEDRVRGGRLVALTADGVRVGPLISFEVFFPDMARNLARGGASVLAVQSMTSSFQDSWAPEQAASVSAARAVETDRPVVYSTMSGVSAAFDGRGRRLGWLSTARRGALVVDVPLSSGTTPYVRLGHWVPAAALVIVALAVARAWRRSAASTAPERL
jgi:apolipoprotein N-acyltransferase